jgi:hypothetical protein
VSYNDGPIKRFLSVVSAVSFDVFIQHCLASHVADENLLTLGVRISGWPNERLHVNLGWLVEHHVP